MKMALLLSAVSIVGSLSPTIMQANALGVQEEEVVTERVGVEDPDLALRFTKQDIDAARANGFAQGLAAAVMEEGEGTDGASSIHTPTGIPTFGPRFEASMRDVKTMFATPFMQVVQLDVDHSLDLSGMGVVIMKHLVSKLDSSNMHSRDDNNTMLC